MRQPDAGPGAVRAGRAEPLAGVAEAGAGPGAGVPGQRNPAVPEYAGPDPAADPARLDPATLDPATLDPARLDARPDQLLPPGQHIQAAMPVLHYGPVPAFQPHAWDLRVYGATESGGERRWTWADFQALPRCEVVADFHCVTKFSVTGVVWSGVAGAEVLAAAPPSGDATHVMIWADYGYGANVPISVFAAADTLLATHRDGAELTPEHGFPVRLVAPSRYAWKSVKWVRAIEYLVGDRRGFWEERGYHNSANPWLEQRYSYQELPGEGPAI